MSNDSAAETPGASSDAVTIARWIVGWWPGLEDGIPWGGDVDGHPVLLAAKRILGASRAEAPPAPPDNDGSAWDCPACGTNVIGPSVALPCPHCGAVMQQAKDGST